MIKGKNIVLAVSGGIAAFKAAALTSQMVQAGANVKVMMTSSAQKFVTPLTFQALSRHAVFEDTFNEPDPSKIAHIDLADWADVIVVAPATANIISKLAHGMADDMITTTILATKAKVFIVPAMNVNMYQRTAVQRNFQTLKQDGFSFIEGDEGYLACGWVGKGRMAEPEAIVHVLHTYFHKDEPLKGKKVLITAGPTQEKIDPVRFFTNHSTGKMGYAIAEAAHELGAEVTLISGPTNLTNPSGIDIVNVTSAQEMLEAVLANFERADLVIKSAAVADYRPKETFVHKRKKQPGQWSIEMERTTDILKMLGERKTSQILVGFAAESEHLIDNAKKKLKAKNLDFIIANNIIEEGSGFKGDTNKITTISQSGEIKEHPLLSKKETARTILNEVIPLLERMR